MELYIGGKYQGKYEYVKEVREVCEELIWNHYETWFLEQLTLGNNPEWLTEEQLNKNPDIFIISDEIGNGIVPVDKKEREYRERLGRMLCVLAGKASRVERIVCGIGQRIK